MGEAVQQDAHHVPAQGPRHGAWAWLAFSMCARRHLRLVLTCIRVPPIPPTERPLQDVRRRPRGQAGRRRRLLAQPAQRQGARAQAPLLPHRPPVRCQCQCWPTVRPSVRLSVCLSACQSVSPTMSNASPPAAPPPHSKNKAYVLTGAVIPICAYHPHQPLCLPATVPIVDGPL